MSFPLSNLISHFLSILYSVEQIVKDDLKVITSSKYMRKELTERTKGYIYDIKTGKLSLV